MRGGCRASSWGTKCQPPPPHTHTPRPYLPSSAWNVSQTQVFLGRPTATSGNDVGRGRVMRRGRCWECGALRMMARGSRHPFGTGVCTGMEPYSGDVTEDEEEAVEQGLAGPCRDLFELIERTVWKVSPHSSPLSPMLPPSFGTPPHSPPSTCRSLTTSRSTWMGAWMLSCSTCPRKIR